MQPGAMPGEIVAEISGRIITAETIAAAQIKTAKRRNKPFYKTGSLS